VRISRKTEKNTFAVSDEAKELWLLVGTEEHLSIYPNRNSSKWCFGQKSFQKQKGGEARSAYFACRDQKDPAPWRRLLFPRWSETEGVHLYHSPYSLG
jgi:hypothetical protein